MGGDSFFLGGDEDVEFSVRQSTTSIIDDIDSLSNPPSTGAMGILQQLNQGISPNFSKGTMLDSEDEIVDNKLQKESPTKMNFADIANGLGILGVNPSFLNSLSSSNGEEEEHFENDLDEIMFFGGDPAFMDSEVPARSQTDSNDEEYDEILESGGDVFFLDKPPPFPNEIFKFRGMDNDRIVEKGGEIDGLSVLRTLADLSAGPSPWNGLEGSQQVDDDDEDEQRLLDEIEAMGGDPFFLDMTEAILVLDTSEEELSSATKATTVLLDTDVEEGRRQEDTDGDGQEWEWDGVVDDDAHLE